MDLSSPATLDGRALPAAASIDLAEGKEAESIWASFADAALLTPYQSSGWLAGVEAAFGKSGEPLRLLLIRIGGHILAALPFTITRHWGITLAEIPGSSLGNSDWMPQLPGATLDKPLLSRAFATLSGSHGVDVLRFANLPPDWQGTANPLLAFDAAPSPDHFYVGSIDPGTLDNLPKRRRVDIQRGRRRLEELVGPVSLRRARTEAEVEEFHAAFLAQRDTRFRQMGVTNIFAEPAFVALFDDLGKASLGEPRPVMRVDALLGGDEVLATAIGIQTRSHYSQYINSNTSGPAAKYSLMGLLMYLLVEDLTAEGIRSLDLGVGDFGYKEVWTQKTEVFDLVLPLTAKGRLVAPAFRAKRSSKRLIKQNEHLWQFAKRLRLLKQSLHTS
ncbi:MAG: hypothetical protein ABS75_32265 [Pelagibacterium sp. SCN 63-23]|nr:MAG: hypothetical protein ABS75_32265 [Pelagibacterium sp. SCN 63-23]